MIIDFVKSYVVCEIMSFCLSIWFHFHLLLDDNWNKFRNIRSFHSFEVFADENSIHSISARLGNINFAQQSTNKQTLIKKLWAFKCFDWKQYFGFNLGRSRSPEICRSNPNGNNKIECVCVCVYSPHRQQQFEHVLKYTYILRMKDFKVEMLKDNIRVCIDIAQVHVCVMFVWECINMRSIGVHYAPTETKKARTSKKMRNAHNTRTGTCLPTLKSVWAHTSQAFRHTDRRAQSKRCRKIIKLKQNNSFLDSVMTSINCWTSTDSQAHEPSHVHTQLVCVLRAHTNAIWSRNDLDRT